jgi:D-alanine--poly(phosphoribitol) ligase subunit 1
LSRSAGIPVDAFFENYRHSPAALALSIGDHQVSYGELGCLTEGIRRLLDHAAGAGKLVGVVGAQDVPTYASLLAILASGRAYVPLVPDSPLARSLDVIRQTGIDTLLSSQAEGPLQQACKDRRIRVVDTSNADRKPLTPPTGVGVDDLAYVLFTSGSTGTPKGVPIRHRNLNRFFRAMNTEFGHLFGASDRFLQMFELSFDVSVMAFFYPLTLGASVHVVPPKRRRTSFDVLNTVQSAKVTVATMVPSALLPVPHYGQELQLPDVRVSILTGEGLPVSLAHSWANCIPNARQFNLYGPTEATIWAGIYDYSDDLPEVAQDRGVVSIGRPFDGLTFQVVDAALAPVTAGEKGELCLAGEQVADGYWEAPELTTLAFHSAHTGNESSRPCYRTGDYVREAEGRFLYLGRIDDQVQVGGHRVELGEVEHHARRILHAHQVAAVARMQGDGLAQIVLCVEGAAVAVAELMSALRASLPHYMVPYKILVLPSFPLSASGKVDRKQLRALVETGS